MTNETVYVVPQPEALLVVEENVDVVQVTTPGPQGPPGSPGPLCITFGLSGDIVVGEGQTRWYNDFAVSYYISSVRATLGRTPVGGPVIVDVNVDGSTIFLDSNDRPTIQPGEETAMVTTDGAYVSVGSYLSADIDEVGLNDPGAHLLIQVYLTT